MEERRILVRSFNNCITCRICGGYFVDATTVKECMHTFCKSCIVRYLQENRTCPGADENGERCDTLFRQTDRTRGLMFDNFLQDLVYKLVPNLQENEIQREMAFYRTRGLPCPKKFILKKCEPENKETENTSEVTTKENEFQDAHNELVDLYLQPLATNGGAMKHLKKSYVRCPSVCKLTHVRKFIAQQLYGSKDKYKNVEILCNGEFLKKDYSLKLISISKWINRNPPLMLNYQTKVVTEQ